MNRDELDAFFAKADDVLTDWHGGTDAMHGTPPTGDGDELAPPGSSYYEQQPRGNTFTSNRLSTILTSADHIRVSLNTSEPLTVVPVVEGNMFVAPADIPFDGDGWTFLGYTTFDAAITTPEAG